MELRQLKYFLALAETKNYTVASKLLFITQPTLSQQIASLEAELDTKLFDRTKRRVELTAAGTRLYEHARIILANLDKCTKDMDYFRLSNQKTIRIDTLQEFEGTFLPNLINLFHKHHPDIKIEYRTSNFAQINNFVAKQDSDLVVNLFFPGTKIENYDLFRFNSDHLVLAVSKDAGYNFIHSFHDPYIKKLLELKCYLYKNWYDYSKPMNLIKRYVPNPTLEYYDTLSEFIMEANLDSYTIIPYVFLINTAHMAKDMFHIIPLPPQYGKLDLCLGVRKNSSKFARQFYSDAVDYALLANIKDQTAFFYDNR